jgi:hypothetical protein
VRASFEVRVQPTAIALMSAEALARTTFEGFWRVSDTVLAGSPDESDNGRVMGGEPGVAYGQYEKRDQAAAISIGHHAAVRSPGTRKPQAKKKCMNPTLNPKPTTAERDSCRYSPLANSRRITYASSRIVYITAIFARMCGRQALRAAAPVRFRYAPASGRP